MGKRKYKYERKERIYTKDGKETHWSYLKDTKSRGRFERRIIAECDCGNVSAVNLYHILNGHSTKCVECSKKERKGRVLYTNPESLIQKSKEIGKSRAFFSNIKTKYPKKFKEMLSLGKGDLATGYYRYMAIKPYRKYLKENSMIKSAKELKLRDTYFYTLKTYNIDAFIEMLDLGKGDLVEGYKKYKEKHISLYEASLRIGKKRRYFTTLKYTAPEIFQEMLDLGNGYLIKGYNIYLQLYGEVKIKESK